MKKLLQSLLAVLMVAVVLTGCSTEATVTDREGNEVVIPKKLERIISTAPSNTEVLIELGMADKLVAVDKYSPTEELNEDVTIIDFRSPDAETIIGLEPDLIIASGHNKSGGEDPFAAIKEAGIPVVYIPSSVSFEAIYADIVFVADIVGEKKAGDKIIEEMQAEVAKIVEIAATITEKKSVYLEISPAPYIYSTGSSTFQNEILELIGAENIFASEEGWISASAESIIEANPDVIITTVGYVENPVDEILTREGWDSITAISKGDVFQVDGNASSRPSHNVIKALKEIAKAVYPDKY
jgi:iron complex transport system substrate-binding protein